MVLNLGREIVCRTKLKAAGVLKGFGSDSQVDAEMFSQAWSRDDRRSASGQVERSR